MSLRLITSNRGSVPLCVFWAISCPWRIACGHHTLTTVHKLLIVHVTSQLCTWENKCRMYASPSKCLHHNHHHWVTTLIIIAWKLWSSWLWWNVNVTYKKNKCMAVVMCKILVIIFIKLYTVTDLCVHVRIHSTFRFGVTNFWSTARFMLPKTNCRSRTRFMLPSQCHRLPGIFLENQTIHHNNYWWLDCRIIISLWWYYQELKKQEMLNINPRFVCLYNLDHITLYSSQKHLKVKWLWFDSKNSAITVYVCQTTLNLLTQTKVYKLKSSHSLTTVPLSILSSMEIPILPLHVKR